MSIKWAHSGNTAVPCYLGPPQIHPLHISPDLCTAAAIVASITQSGLVSPAPQCVVPRSFDHASALGTHGDGIYSKRLNATAKRPADPWDQNEGQPEEVPLAASSADEIIVMNERGDGDVVRA